MGKKPSKALDNIYCAARCEAAEHNDALSSRESAAQILGIDRTRLARIELDSIIPYPDEVMQMAQVYNTPELCNAYCSEKCSIGRQMISKVTMDDFDRLSLRLLASLKNANNIRDSLISISEDGKINPYEREDFERMLEDLDKISSTAQALRIWAMKHLGNDNDE